MTSKIEITRLHQADWKIWFLGGGLGGAMGLCILAIILTINSGNSVPPLIATALGLTHGLFLFGFWLARFKTSFRFAWRVTMAVSSICTLGLALSLQHFSQNSQGAGSLYMLSFMQAGFALSLPLYYNPQKLDANAG